MKQFLTRDKFKTEIGRQMFDELLKIDSDLNWVYVILHNCKGDTKRKEFLEWLHQSKRTALEITKHVVFS